jgi:hypothetical protein
MQCQSCRILAQHNDGSQKIDPVLTSKEILCCNRSGRWESPKISNPWGVHQPWALTGVLVGHLIPKRGVSVTLS